MDLRLALLVGLAVFLAAGDASAGRYLDPKRKGFQFDAAVGASFCLPAGQTPCRSVSGATAPLVGAGITAGWRPRSWLFLGAAYDVASLRPTYTDILGSNGRTLYGTAVQHAVFGALRTGVDIDRIDLGLEIGLGYSRVSAPFAVEELRGQRFASSGLALRLSPQVAVYLTRRVFLGLRWNVTLNLHRRTQCGSACEEHPGDAPAFGHHAMFGLMVGATI